MVCREFIQDAQLSKKKKFFLSNSLFVCNFFFQVQNSLWLMLAENTVLIYFHKAELIISRKVTLTGHSVKFYII